MDENTSNTEAGDIFHSAEDIIIPIKNLVGIIGVEPSEDIEDTPDIAVEDDDDDGLAELEEKFNLAHQDDDSDDEASEASAELNEDEDETTAKFERRKENPYRPRTTAPGEGTIPIRNDAEVENTEHGSKLQIDDTFFSDAFSSMARQGYFDFDNDYLDRLNNILLEDFKKQSSIQMSINDIGRAITTLGVDVNLNHKQMLMDMLNLLQLKTTRNLIQAIGLDEYADEIMVRTIERVYGSSNRIARERAIKQREEDESRLAQEAYLKRIEKHLAELTKRNNETQTNASKPTSVFLRQSKQTSKESSNYHGESRE